MTIKLVGIELETGEKKQIIFQDLDSSEKHTPESAVEVFAHHVSAAMTTMRKRGIIPTHLQDVKWEESK